MIHFRGLFDTLQQAPRRHLDQQSIGMNQTKVGVGEIDLSKPVDLIVLGIKKGESARCRLRSHHLNFQVLEPSLAERVLTHLLRIGRVCDQGKTVLCTATRDIEKSPCAVHR